MITLKQFVLRMLPKNFYHAGNILLAASLSMSVLAGGVRKVGNPAGGCQ